MKPFGVRLAAGAVTILLGAIMAAQAQKDHQTEINSAWSPEIKTVPSEMVPLQGTWATGDSQSDQPAVQLSPFDDVKDAVQLVQHTEPATPTPSFGVPEGAADSLANALMNLPATLGADDQQAVAPPMNLPDPLADAPGGNVGLNAGPGMGAPPMGMMAQDIPPNMNPGGVDPANMLRGEQDAPQPLRPQDPQENVMNTSPASMIRALALPGESQPMREQTPVQPDLRSSDNDLRLAQNGPVPQLPMPTGNRFVQEDHGMQSMPRDNRGMQDVRAQNGFVDQNQSAQQNRFGQNQLGQQNRLSQQNQFGQNEPNYQLSNSGQNAAYDRNAINRALQYDPNSDYSRNTAPPLPDNTVPRPAFRGTMARPAAHALPKGNYAPAATADQLRGNTTYAQPGDRRLEGAQAPSVVIHKRAPAEVKVGKPATFVIQVQNVGSAEATDVRVHDRVPQGMRLVDATPRPTVVGNDGELVWQLGSLGAGEERQVTMQLVPEQEGELGSVARVTFEAAASVRTMSTRPEIKITQRAAKEVLIGQQLEIELEISNPGTGEATGVILQEDVPDGLDHPKGRQLDNLIGTLRPGELRRQMLRLKAVAPGVVQNTIRLKADDGLETSHTVSVNVIAPKLQIQLTGPKVRYLERQATFTLDIANSGTARAENVEIAAFLDRGFTFVSTENEGSYDSSRHAVYWSVEDLPVGAHGQIPLVLLPVQEGARAIQLEAKADLGIVAQNETQVAVNSLAELTFSISDTSDPIEIGGETTYEIKIKNSGSRPDSNVVLNLQFPPGLEVLSTDGDAQQQPGGVIAFRAKPQLAANGEIVYQIKTRGVQPGTHLIKAVVQSQESRVPVTKEESTMVYDDRTNIATQPGAGAPPFQR